VPRTDALHSHVPRTDALHLHGMTEVCGQRAVAIGAPGPGGRGGLGLQLQVSKG